MKTDRPLIAVADIGWYTTEHLFRAVDPVRAETLLLTCMDFVNARNKGIAIRRWWTSTRRTAPTVRERTLILPPGWMGRFANFGMSRVASVVRAAARNAGPLTFVATYPQYLAAAERLEPERLVYYNVDDYRLYWPGRADAVDEAEKRIVRAANLTVCVAGIRADELRRTVPEAADRIIHLPHGAPEAALSPGTVLAPAEPPADLAGLPRPLLGFVGSLGDRVDWPLLDRLAAEFPDGSIVLVGDAGGDGDEPWRRERRACLARPNVHAIGPRPQAAIHAYNRCFDVALIPYRTDHPFNVACSPTKIMDCLATGRPIVSTAVPECLLYEHLIDIASDAERFAASARRIAEANSDDGRGRARFEHAAANTCAVTVSRLLDRIG